MRADEVKPFFEALEADLQEADPSLRTWYETEMSMTPEYRQAQGLREKLQGFGDGLALVIESARTSEAETGDEEIVFEGIEEIIDEDEYLTPEQKKRRSVLGWLGTVMGHYDDEVRQINVPAKKSERQRELVGNRFARQFEHYGEEDQHLLYDPEAFGYALDELMDKRPALAERVTQKAEEYMHKNGVVFAEEPAAFAGVIKGSIADRPSAHNFERIWSAIYDRKNFTSNPLDAVRLHIAAAHAFFEAEPTDNQVFYEKIIDTVYLRNDVVKPKSDYISCMNSYLGIATHLPERRAEVCELLNARYVFSEAMYAYLNKYPDYFEIQQQFESPQKGVRAMQRVHRELGASAEAIEDLPEDLADFINSPGLYDRFQVTNLTDGTAIPTSTDDKTIPEGWRDAYTSASLYRKRMKTLAPRATVHDMLLSTVNSKDPDVAQNLQITDVPVSPGVTISYFYLLEEGEGPVVHEREVSNHILGSLLTEHFDSLANGLEPSEGNVFHFGRKADTAEINGKTFYYTAIIRPSVPEDLKSRDKCFGLITSFGLDILDYTDRESTGARIDSKRADIRQHQHNYVGRRPLRFRLPEALRDRGLDALFIRRHPDRRRFIVTADHKQGSLDFTFNEAWYCVDVARSPLTFALEDLTVSLAREWACREVIETSEGPVRGEDTKSRVNLGFLRYLPVGARPSINQARAFALEQAGNLAEESLRRRPEDPRGENRNSTYVRENYDPSRPPLDVYYDQEAVGFIS